MVITLHVAADYFYKFFSQPFWIIPNVFDSLVRPCVPLFFMISGALLLGRAAKENFFSFIFGRYKKIFWPLLFWSSLACLAFVVKNHEPPFYFILRLFASNGFYHLWYLYALIGLYALLPIVGKWYASAGKEEIIFFLAIWFCASSASILIDPLNKLAGKSVDILTLYNAGEFASYLGFFVLGAFIFENAPRPLEKLFSATAWLALFVLCGLLTAAVTHIFSNIFSEAYSMFFKYRSPLVILASACYFIFALRSNVGERKIFSLVSIVSKYSFGIYCSHAFVLWVVQKAILSRADAFITNSWIAAAVIVATSAVVLLLSLAVAFVFKKIPLLRKVV